MNACRAIRVCLMGALLPADTLTASGQAWTLTSVRPTPPCESSYGGRLPIESSPEHHVTGRCPAIFRESRVNALTLNLALAIERACPSMAWHGDPEGLPADSRNGLSQLNPAIWYPQGTTANAAAALLWCLPLFRTWHELKGGRSRSLRRKWCRTPLNLVAHFAAGIGVDFRRPCWRPIRYCSRVRGLRRPTCGRSV
jgi:hypothetical protein